MTKRNLPEYDYKTATWNSERVAILGYYGTGEGTTWKIRTIKGETNLVDQIELSRFSREPATRV